MPAAKARSHSPKRSKKAGNKAKLANYSPPLVTQIYTTPAGFSIRVVRDDLLPGGTKQRSMVPTLAKLSESEVVLPAANQGFAQVAVAVAANMTGKVGTVFIADRAKETPATQLARKLGGNLKPVRPGYMTVIKKRSHDYVDQRNHEEPGSTRLFALGGDDPVFESTLLSELRKAVPAGFRIPKRVWVAVGSGVLLRVIGQLWPKAELLGVVVGMKQTADQILGAERAKNCQLFVEEKLAFEKPTRDLPPWPTVANYDGKLWKFIKEFGQEGDLVWNVASIE
jgi:hypothetical protein